MKFSTGLIVVLVSLVFFYLRIGYLRGKKKRYEREYALKRRKVGGRSKGSPLPQKTPGTPPYGINNWFLVGGAMVLIIGGMLLYNKMTILGLQIIKNEAFLNTYSDYWYIPLALGVIVFAFCFKIDKPIMDE
jgi:hypothetical protein